MKIGLGYDIHGLVNYRSLILGGVEIPYIKGLEGHSDGDVLIHAIIDALLGAIGKGDIGTFFPDTDAAFKNISSLILLEKINAEVIKNGFRIINIDSVVVTEVPRLEPFKEAITNKIAQTLGIDKEAVNVKAKTNERYDSVGESKAIASYAVVLLEKNKKELQ